MVANIVYSVIWFLASPKAWGLKILSSTWTETLLLPFTSLSDAHNFTKAQALLHNQTVIKIRLHHTPAFNSIFISWPIFLNVHGINFSIRIIALVKCYRAVHMFQTGEVGTALPTPLIGPNSISINGIKTILFKTGGLNPVGARGSRTWNLWKASSKARIKASRWSFSVGFVLVRFGINYSEINKISKWKSKSIRPL